jgi:hypothetical protein
MDWILKLKICLLCCLPLSLVYGQEGDVEEAFQKHLATVHATGADASLEYDGQYQVLFKTQCPYSEVIIPRMGKESPLVDGGHIFRSETAGRCLEKPHVPEQPLEFTLRSNGVEASERSVEIIDYPQFWGSTYQASSYGGGKYVILEKSAILQQGGQTSWGITTSLFLEKK